MSGAYTPPSGTVPRAAVAGLYQGQVVSTGSASGVLNESNEVSQAENLDLEEVVFETVAGAGFGLWAARCLWWKASSTAWRPRPAGIWSG